MLDKLLATYEATAPELASWARDNVPHGFAAFELPTSHRRCPGTTNLLERSTRNCSDALASRPASPTTLLFFDSSLP